MPDQTSDASDTGTAQANKDGPSALQANALTVGYPSLDAPVIERADIEIPRRQLTVMIGPNGSGKSTLLKTLARHLSPAEGRVLLDGEDVQSMGRSEFARRLGILFQEHPAPGSMTVEQLAYQGRYPHRGMFSSISEEDHRAVNEAFSLTDMEHLRDRSINELSGGQRQLAWIVMALAQQPDVLLLDEPTTFLDLRHQLEVMQIIERLRDDREMTVVVVLHDINRAVRYADHIIAMRNGSVFSSGPPLEVITADLLRQVFDVDADLLRDNQGNPICVPNAVVTETDES